ncbi:MAG: magnesium/cobalt transporter CorA [Candidatus Nanoarchaeia archaeon]
MSIYKHSQKKGLPPGSLVFVGYQKVEHSSISLISYSKHTHKIQKNVKVTDLSQLSKDEVHWININGIHDTQLVNSVGELFSIHSLTLEDILNTNQRPKIELFEKYYYTTIKMLSYNKKSKSIQVEQISCILIDNYVLLFQETKEDIFEPIRKRIAIPDSRIRSRGADYLLYILLDIIVDQYFEILEHLGNDLEQHEEELLLDNNRDILNNIYQLKREIIFLRRNIWPLREAIAKLEKQEEHIFIQDSTLPYLRDLYDHVIQVIDTIENNRELSSALLELYVSNVNTRLNEVMKTLTIFAAIFIPLTFIVGIYGMNFENMPELTWKYGYYGILGFMGVLVVVLLSFFKYRKWI